MIRCRQLSFGNESQIPCRQHTFSSGRWFVEDNTISALNANSLQTTWFWQRITNSLQNTHFWQRILIRCRQLSFNSESQISCRRHNFDSECSFAAANIISVVNANLLQPTQFQQRMLFCRRQLNFDSESQIRYRKHTFSNECWFAADNTALAMNANSLHATQFQQRITNLLQNIHFRQRTLIHSRQLNFGSESQIHCRTLTFSSKC